MVFQSRAVWQPSEGSRLWGYLLPMLLVLPVVLVWPVLAMALAWESVLLLGLVATFGAFAASWLLYLRTL